MYHCLKVRMMPQMSSIKLVSSGCATIGLLLLSVVAQAAQPLTDDQMATITGEKKAVLNSRCVAANGSCVADPTCLTNTGQGAGPITLNLCMDRKDAAGVVIGKLIFVEKKYNSCPATGTNMGEACQEVSPMTKCMDQWNYKKPTGIVPCPRGNYQNKIEVCWTEFCRMTEAPAG